jgi:hypothetical protein
MSRAAVLLHRQRSPENLQQLLCWCKIRDTLLGQNCVEQDVKKALELASVCQHPNAVWLTKLLAGCDVSSRQEAREVCLGCENDPRAVCFAGLLGGRMGNEIGRAADLGDAFAQAWMTWQSVGDDEAFRWLEKSAAQGERHGFCYLGHCYRDGIGCEQDVERAKENFLVAAELEDVFSMVCSGRLVDKDDTQRFFWFGRAAANGDCVSFLNEMSAQIRNFSSGTRNAAVVFVIGRALKGQVDNEKRTILGAPPALTLASTPQIERFISTNFSCNRTEKQSTAGQLLG